MARLTAAQRAAKGAAFLDKNRPLWSNKSNIDLEQIDVWHQQDHCGLGKAFYRSIRGMTDEAAEEHGFKVPHFDASSHEEYVEKRKAFAALLTKAWKTEVFSRQQKKADRPGLKACSEQPRGQVRILQGEQ